MTNLDKFRKILENAISNGFSLGKHSKNMVLTQDLEILCKLLNNKEIWIDEKTLSIMYFNDGGFIEDLSLNDIILNTNFFQSLYGSQPSSNIEAISANLDCYMPLYKIKKWEWCLQSELNQTTEAFDWLLSQFNHLYK